MVVRPDVVAIGERRPHDVPVRLKAANAEVDRVGRVENQYFGRIFSRPAVDRAVLCESLEQRRLAPDRFVQHPVQAHRRGLDAWRVHVDLSQTTVVDRLLIAWGLYENEKNGEHGTKTTM